MVDLKSQKYTSFLKNGNKNNEEIITTTNFSKSNKNKEEYMRCFLVCKSHFTSSQYSIY